MKTKKTYQLSILKIIILIVISVFIGISLVYIVSNITKWCNEKYQTYVEQYAVKSKEYFNLRNLLQVKPEQDTQPLKVVSEQSQVIDVVKKSSPAVVSIVASEEVPIFETYYDNPSNGLFNFWIPQRRQNGTEQRRIGAGTGFIVSSDGYIVTNGHVVASKDAKYVVYLNSEENRGEKIEAKVVARDPNTDLAILKIDRNELPFLTFGDSDKLQVGQTAITIGYALGEFDNTVSKGVVSGLYRSIVAGGGFGMGAERLKNLIQTDAAINPGNSGGPMLDIEGNVIGVNVAMASAENIGFAIPGNDAKSAFEEVRKNGIITKKKQAFLGVRYVLINEQIQRENNLPYKYGALIMRGQTIDSIAVAPGSPADEAGLVENDIILEINGIKINERNTLADLIAKYKKGDKVTLRIYHKGKEKEIKVELGEM